MPRVYVPGGKGPHACFSDPNLRRQSVSPADAEGKV